MYRDCFNWKSLKLGLKVTNCDDTGTGSFCSWKERLDKSWTNTLISTYQTLPRIYDHCSQSASAMAMLQNSLVLSARPATLVFIFVLTSSANVSTLRNLTIQRKLRPCRMCAENRVHLAECKLSHVVLCPTFLTFIGVQYGNLSFS